MTRCGEGTVPAIVDREVIDADPHGPDRGRARCRGARLRTGHLAGGRRPLDPTRARGDRLPTRPRAAGRPPRCARRARRPCRAAAEAGGLPGLRFVGYTPRPGAIGYMSKAGEARRQGDRRRAQVPPLRACRKSCASRAAQAPRTDANDVLVQDDQQARGLRLLLLRKEQSLRTGSTFAFLLSWTRTGGRGMAPRPPVGSSDQTRSELWTGIIGARLAWTV